VESEQIKTLAPAYVKNLRAALSVVITDPTLKALDASVRAQAEAAGTNADAADPAK
jgi:hypothetical protein